MSHNHRNGFVSTIWGPALWLSLHCISMNYPCNPTTEDKRVYRAWFEGLGSVLPCGACRDNFQTNLEAIHYDPINHYNTRTEFSYMVYKLHVNVRIMQGKKNEMTFLDCLAFYERFRAQDCLPNTTTGEGGCMSRKPVTCTLYISPTERATTDENRIRVDPECIL